MLRKSVLVLVCAAAATFVSAQWGWGDDSGSQSWGASEETSSSPEAASDGASEPSLYDVGSPAEPSSEASFSNAFDSAPAAEPETAAPQRERTPKAPKAPRERGENPKFAGPQKTCPVCASIRLKNNLYVVSDGKKIHVCSSACIGRVKRNPSAFIARLEARGEKLGQ